MYRMTSALERGNSDLAVELAGSVQPAHIASPERRAKHWLDTGRALAALRDREHDAAATFQRSETLAALRLRSNIYAREAVTDLLPRVRCELRAASCELRAASCELRAASCAGSPTTVRGEDLRGIRHLARRLGDQLLGGIVLYAGVQLLPFGDRLRTPPHLHVVDRMTVSAKAQPVSPCSPPQPACSLFGKIEPH